MTRGFASTAKTKPRASGIALTVGALGVVFVDIGTSSIYTVTALSAEQHASGPLDQTTIFGMTSTLIWALILIVTVLYVTILLRADNDGEGGLLALLGLIRLVPQRAARRGLWVVLAGIGAAMFLGDSIITPAISVLSAVEGLELIHAGLSAWIVPITLAILLTLFVVQSLGVHRVARAFGPIMLLWFAAIAAFGLYSVAQHPEVLLTLSPHWIFPFFATHPLIAFLSLGSVVLAVTGAEALYADMGHFGRKSVTRAWHFIVFPALTLAYLGQASVLLDDGGGAGGIVFAMVPEPLIIPMILLATAATIIASQAVISGAFTVVHQASRLDLMVPLRVIHTSPEEQRQVYLPTVNWLLAIVVMGVVVLFKSSENLTAAYGVAVTTTITVTSTLFLVLSILRREFTWRFWTTCVVWLVVLVFLAANLPKIASGGWLPLAIGAVLSALMFCWRSGRKQLARWRHRQEMSSKEFLQVLDAGGITRVPGTGVFFTPSSSRVPLALRTMALNQRVLPEQIVLFTWETAHVPIVPEHDRIRIADVTSPEPVISLLKVQYGYRERMRPVRSLREAVTLEPSLLGNIDVDRAVYYLSMPIVEVVTTGPRKWSRAVFALLVRMRTDPVNQLALPRDRTIIIGREAQL